MTKEEQRAIDCAVQHIKVFRQQHIDDVTARLGQSCEECPHNSECNFSFFDQLGPLLKNTGIKISAAINYGSGKGELKGDENMVLRFIKENWESMLVSAATTILFRLLIG